MRIKIFFFALALQCCALAGSAQHLLVVKKILNGHEKNFFKENEKIICSIHHSYDTSFQKLTGKLSVISDSIIKINSDTVAIRDITSIKKFHTFGGKLLRVILLSYTGIPSIIIIGITELVLAWAEYQNINDQDIYPAATGGALIATYSLMYYFVSNSSIFKAYNHVGNKFVLEVQ